MWSAIVPARRAPSSPGNITGVIGCGGTSSGRTAPDSTPANGSRSKPASVINVRNSTVFSITRARPSALPSMSSSAAAEPATTVGATELENR